MAIDGRLVAAVIACVDRDGLPGHRFAAGPSPPDSADTAKADAVLRVTQNFMAQAHLKAVIVRITVDGKEIVTQAVGDSMSGVPATPDMHFRNGAVAISYVSTLLLKLVDEKKLSLDDKLSTWLPDFPNAGRVTLGQLAQMTAGYPDYVIGNQQFETGLYANPFQQWTTQDILGQISGRPLLYEPGSNWNYAHTDYVLLGLALEKATGRDMPTLLRDEVLGPLGLKSTANSDTPEIPQPVLHAFSSERRAALKIPAGTPFYEESTYWNCRGPSRTAPFRPPPSTTWRPPRSESARASCSRRTHTRRWCRPRCAARHTLNRAARPASSRTRAIPTASGSSPRAIG